MTTRLAKALIPILASVAMILGFTSAPASAYGTSALLGSPGVISPYKVEGGAYLTGSPSTYKPGIWVPGPKITRSPATSGQQNTVVQYRLYRAEANRWALTWTTTSPTMIIPAGTSQIGVYDAWHKALSPGYYYVDITVVWSDARGNFLGARTIVMNSSLDYQCRSSFYVTCSVGSGYIYVG